MENRYEIEPMNEPYGEGNGWHDCPPEHATAFYIFDQFHEAIVEHCETFDAARAMVRKMEKDDEKLAIA